MMNSSSVELTSWAPGWALPLWMATPRSFLHSFLQIGHAGLRHLQYNYKEKAFKIIAIANMILMYT